MSDEDKVYSSLLYVLFCSGIFIACYIVSHFLIKYPKLGFISTTTAVPVALMQAFNPHSAFNVSYFNLIKGLSVFIPMFFYSWCNLYLEKKPENSKMLGSIFSIILAANIMETILMANKFIQIIYGMLAAILAISTITLKWKFEEVLGFNNTKWTICFFFLLTYLYVFLFPPGSGIFAFFILLIPYIPFSRIKQRWFAYRIYSLWCYCIIYFLFNMRKTILAIPNDINHYMEIIRIPFINNIFIVIIVFFEILLIKDCLKRYRQVN